MKYGRIFGFVFIVKVVTAKFNLYTFLKLFFAFTDQSASVEPDTVSSSQPQMQLVSSQQPTQPLVITQAQMPGGFETSSQQPQSIPQPPLLQGQGTEFRQPLPPPRPRFPPNSVVIRGPNSVHVPLQTVSSSSYVFLLMVLYLDFLLFSTSSCFKSC